MLGGCNLAAAKPKLDMNVGEAIQLFQASSPTLIKRSVKEGPCFGGFQVSINFVGGRFFLTATIPPGFEMHGHRFSTLGCNLFGKTPVQGAYRANCLSSKYVLHV